MEFDNDNCVRSTTHPWREKVEHLKKRKTIPEQVEELIKEICDEYCKWPLIYHEEKETAQLTRKCERCPLARLI